MIRLVGCLCSDWSVAGADIGSAVTCGAHLGAHWCDQMVHAAGHVHRRMHGTCVSKHRERKADAHVGAARCGLLNIRIPFPGGKRSS